MKKTKRELSIIGWREFVALPKLKVPNIKVKVDTGARSSSLHAYDVKSYKRAGKEYVSFDVHPDQKNNKNEIHCNAEVLEYRKIKSSNGQTELRPVILTDILLNQEVWKIELTLTNRDEMGFRMLLGRSSIKDRFLVDSGKSYQLSKKEKK